MSIEVRCRGWNDIQPVDGFLVKGEAVALLQCREERNAVVNDTRGNGTRCRPSQGSEMARAGRNVNDDACT